MIFNKLLSNNTQAKVIEVVDLTGRVVLSQNNSKENVSIDLSSFSSGVYYVKVQTVSNTDVIKLVKE